MKSEPVEPTFCRSAHLFRRWLEKRHADKAELWVGFYKKDSGKGGITYPEAVDGALCFGWIDGVRKSVDHASYMVRFTPRRATSIWSAVNVKRVRALESLGLMAPAGLEAFRARDPKKTNLYSFENRHRGLDPSYQRTFQKNRGAWQFYRAQPPWYQKTSAWWVISAKREETRLRRLGTLIAQSEKGEWIAGLRRPAGGGAKKRK